MSSTSPLVHVLRDGILVFAAAALGIASLNDIAVRVIPDLVPIGLAVLGITIRLVDGDAATGLTMSSVVLLLAALSWRMGWLGGGDVKLLAACALLVPPALVPQLVLQTALAGGLLALLYLTLGCVAGTSHVPLPTRRPRSLAGRILRAEWRRIRRRAALPYGCAIAVATVLTLVGR